MKQVIIHSVKRVFDHFFKIDEAVLSHELANGGMSEKMTRLSFERGDAVAAMVYHTSIQKFLFTRQFRYPTYSKGPGWLLEAVAGTIEAGEAPEVSLMREMEEELGYQVLTATPIQTFYVSPGGTSERIFLFYAEVNDTMQVSSGGGLAEENEDIEVVALTANQINTALLNGEIADAKTLIGIYWAKNELEVFKKA